MKKWGIDKSVVFPFNTSDEKLIQESKSLLELSKSENSIIPFLRFNPTTTSPEELVSLIKLGFKGIKLHPSAQRFILDDKRFDNIYKTLVLHNLPVLIHTSAHDLNYSTPDKLLNLSLRFPDLKIIMAHFFGNDLGFMDKLIELNSNSIYVDISINARTLRIKNAVESGIKLLFASDAPYDSQGVAKLKVQESDISEEEKEKIFSLNAKELLKI